MEWISMSWGSTARSNSGSIHLKISEGVVIITMKSTYHQIISAVILAFSLVAVAGCGNDDDSSRDRSDANSTMPTGNYQSKLGPDQILSLNFTGNNNVQVTMMDGAHEESYVTSFVTSGETIVVNIPEAERRAARAESMTLKRNGQALEWVVEGMTITLAKP